MVFSGCKIVILLVCIGFLALQPEMVSGLRSMDLVILRNLRILETVGVEVLQTPETLAPVPSMAFDPNQSSKRSIGGGSDPIHNKS
ncbi:CLE45p like [Actinidia chinensis var. chinensis]|uniref:CLE45p like n=1 Tax=Actinidia chinensis var. chinensis TaxID=1590841 RepID=A0A2R6PUA9_ACTCC|nr:CLE45p like [Actinidia chinensis var. chinensis]